jgi:hypothetical protein
VEVGLFGCQSTARLSPSGCRLGAPECPIDVSVPTLSAGRPLSLQGRLSEEIPSVSYRFCVETKGLLNWSFQGPAAHLVIRSPNGDVEGPGISRDVRLPMAGCYVLGLSSNTMADSPYGDFVLTIGLKQ